VKEGIETVSLPPILLDLGVFTPGQDPVEDEKGLLKALELVVHYNQNYLDAYPHTPKLYSSGIKYVRDPQGVELWRGIRSCLAAGFADCKSLAAYRVAELRQAGEHATFVLRQKLRPMIGGGTHVLYHVQIQREDQAVEDPSSILGMKDPWAEALNAA
jgi:hypothetical protein